jgi:hypothetical protein
MNRVRPFPSYLSEAKALALDAERYRCIAAVACSAVKTADHAVRHSPQLALRLAVWGTYACNVAKSAAELAAALSEDAIAFLRNSGRDDESNDASKEIACIADTASREAEAFSKEAGDALLSIESTCIAFGTGSSINRPILLAAHQFEEPIDIDSHTLVTDEQGCARTEKVWA